MKMKSNHSVFSASQSLQDQWAPQSICFGCGPANQQGLKIKSFVSNSKQDLPSPLLLQSHLSQSSDHPIAQCRWHAQNHHQAFPGMLSGGIIGTLLDCHSNWTAAWHLWWQKGEGNRDSQIPCTVTALYSVELLKPTPSHLEITLLAQAQETTERKAVIHAELFAGDEKCATCRGTFVTVKPGHPAYHRWTP